MPQITVACHGICTHTAFGDLRRTILTNVSDQNRIDAVETLKASDVHAHVASLTIPTSSMPERSEPWPWWFQPIVPATPSDNTEWRLIGVLIARVEPVSGHRVWTTSSCIPHAGNLPTIQPPPPPLIEPQGSDPILTACYLDLPPTELSGWIPKEDGPIYTTALIDTTALRVTQFITNESVDITFWRDTEIAFSNVPREPSFGRLQDFLLHLFVTGGVPAHRELTTEDIGTCAQIRVPITKPSLMDFDMTGPGCSNTNYP